jgi:hypothetical protein
VDQSPVEVPPAAVAVAAKRWVDRWRAVEEERRGLR